ncbi:non-ribosomal peptide synthetase [Chroococcidiopsis sp. TS-821]|uniref:non-ribosomal peptide synthetase n=1 Tax=Chroococcidiopsis sp. TS-821 TaxID=1378066 RepID=UPI000CEDAC28|nr:non-ribosomal peptide synthetase [Chroococcidiopsis sp. TS-821]PPS41252.1 non-ribosomal peptide synthetase [Chroococcidiopsis sp. TS-821]
MNHSQRIAALSPEQQALLRLRLQQQSSQRLTIPKCNRHAPLAISFAQQRMWFQDQLSIKSAVSNNISIALKITGSLQVNALAQSLREILQRHESLRTTIQTVGGELTQVILPLDKWELPVHDLRLEREGDREQRLVTKQACTPFNLETDLLLRATLLQLADAEYVLLLTMHHIAVDAWSLGIFFRELSALYKAFSRNQPSPLTALPIQYADFAAWQRQSLQGSLLEDLAYWKQKLHNAPDLLQLPCDRPRPAVQSFAGKTLSFHISQSITTALKQLSQASGATLFMTLLAALQTLLFRYTNQDDILVGSPIANRHHPETENLIGCFINTLVLRTNLSGNPTFLELLQRVRETVLEALAHQTLPFEKLVDELQLARSLSYAPLFQVMLVLQNAFSIENIELPGLSVEHSRIDNHTAQFDLTFHLVESDSGLIGKLEYNTDLFDESTIVRLLEHFQILLTGIVTNPHQTLSALPLLTLAEQQQLRAWNQTTTPCSDRCIHELFTAQAEKTPDAIALISGDEQLTYRELNHRANQLARYLQKLGVKPESLVCLCVERSISTIVGLLGILKAGGAYLPLDPTYPQQRLEFILSDAPVSVLLTQESLATKLPKIAATVFLDTDWEKIALEDTTNVTPAVVNHNLAYVIYTSGSTGQPKGVMVEHRSLVNYTLAAVREYEICARDRILQFASISFDAAAEEIFPCLTQGATLILRTDTMLSAIAGFLKTCEDWQLTVLDLPTAFWHQMVTEMATQNLLLPDCVRLVIIGGEQAARDRFMLWQKHVDARVRLVNSYGPTEATIVTTTVDLSELASDNSALPIGKPVSNTKVYILDSSLQPTPIGVPGELYIGGLGVARGYHNRPDLTAQAFIADPFSEIPGARLYKTGDRARWRKDGNIEYLGRIDRQVKVRGFRIELGEIEALLAQHPDVRECIVVDREETTGNKQLVAYIVPACSTLTTLDLRRFLEKRLPKYMVPATFMLLDTLPLNSHGKIDRQALPIPDGVTVTAAFVAPRTDTEVAIAQIFREILNIPQVGIADDFFELGGHSLLATKLIAQLSRVFQVELSIVDLFESPTVAGLAERVVNQTKPHATDFFLVERSPQTPVPLSFSQQYLWHVHHASTTGAVLNSSIIIRIQDSLSPAVVERSLNEIVRRHEILRTVFSVVDGQPMQVVLPALHLPLVYADLEHLAPEVRESAAFDLAINVAQPAFDLSAPLMRTALYRLSACEHWLLVTMHHLITDGWSFHLLLQELHTLIQAFSGNLPSPLPEVSLQYADFALWQKQVYNENAIAQQLQYWQRKLVDEHIPQAQYNSSAIKSKQAKRYFTSISETLVDSVKALSRSLQVTSFVVLLAALKLALAVWSGRREVWIATTIGNRTVPETEGMLGCFINDVILRSQFLPEQTGSTVIKQLQADLNEAIAHKEVPLEWVIAQTRRSRPVNLMASITITASDAGIKRIPHWEIVQVQQGDDIPSELYDEDIPLELYVELSNTIKIGANYSIEQYTVTRIEQLFAIYQDILTKLTIPEIALSQLLPTNPSL